jgi:single-strand DNA-binding protein
MFLIGLARLGKDAEIRFTPDGVAVANLALAFNYGKKGADGKRATQWVDASFWGERAQKLEQYLVKGQLVEVHLVDPHIETYTLRDGASGTKMVAMVNHLEFAGSAPQQSGQQAPAHGQGQQRNSYADQKGSGNAPRPAPKPAPNFSDMDDDIPF